MISYKKAPTQELFSLWSVLFIISIVSSLIYFASPAGISTFKIYLRKKEAPFYRRLHSIYFFSGDHPKVS